MVMSNEFKGADLQGAARKATAAYRLERGRPPCRNNGEDFTFFRRLCYTLKSLLTSKSGKFDFAHQASLGRTLFLGEGNFSFSLCIAKMLGDVSNNLVSTIFEHENELPPNAIENRDKLLSLGIQVYYEVDATKLESTFSGVERFDTIIFQFPNVASRDPIEGRNPNFVLLRNFLKSAAHHLTSEGIILISAVDSAHYRGALQPTEAARSSSFKEPICHDFHPSDYPGYTHVMTHQEGDALRGHDEFCTWVFERE